MAREIKFNGSVERVDLGRGCKAVPSFEPSLDTMGWERAIEGCDRGQNRDFQVLFVSFCP